jgi:AraC-like DNA-binding protein
MGNIIASEQYGLSGAAIAICVIFSILFATSNHSTYKKPLVIFFVASLIGALDEWFWLNQLWRQWPNLTNLYIPFIYLLAPAFFLYVKHITQPTSKSISYLKNKHWVSAGVAALLCLPYFMLNTEVKLSRLSAPAGTLEHLHIFTIGPTLVLGLVIPFSLCYLIAIIKQLNFHTHSVTQFFSNLTNKKLKWVFVMVFTLFIGALFSTIQLFLPTQVSESGSIKTLFLSFELIWLISLGCLTMRQPIIYENAQNFSEVSSKRMEKYQRSGLTETDANRIKNKLNKAMEDELYLDPDLTLSKLSQYTGVADIKLSQVLNTYMQQSFYDYVNKHRIDAACIKIKKNKETFLDIAIAVGFNSRSTFNSAFKNVMNQTPSQYKNHHQILKDVSLSSSAESKLN